MSQHIGDAHPFIEAGDYMGPDRRFRDVEPRDGVYRRESDGRDNDLSDRVKQIKTAAE